MSFRTTAVLVGLLIVVGAGWYIYSRTAPPPPPDTERESPADAQASKDFFSPKPSSDAILRVMVERAGKPKLAFERVETPGEPRSAAEWRMLAPLAVSVEPYKITGLISTLTDLKSDSQFEPGAKGAVSAADAGLEPPAATITLVDKDAKSYAVEIGKKVVLSSDTYVRLVGQKTIHVAKRDFSAQLREDVKDYRSPRLVQFKVDDVVRIRAESEGKAYDLTRAADGQWVVNEPVRAYADKDKVKAFITKFNTLRADEFLDEKQPAPGRFGLDQPWLTFEVTTETKRELPSSQPADSTQPAEKQYETVTAEHKVAIGGFADLKSEKRYVQPGDAAWVAVVTDANAKGLVPNLTELRDPRITRVKAADITTLELTSGGATATLNKLNGAWKGTGDLADLESAAVTDVLQAFEDLRAIDYLDKPEDLAKCGLTEPRAVLRVTAAGVINPITLRIGSDTPSGKNAYVQRADEAGEASAPLPVIVVSAAQAARLAVGPLTLRSREILTFPTDRLRKVHVERGGTRYDLVSQYGVWKLTDPPAPADMSSVHTLTTDLSRLRAKTVAGKGDLARFGLDQPALTIRFEVDESPATQPATRPTPPATQATQPAGQASQPATPASSAPSSAPATAAAPQLAEHTLRVARKNEAVYACKDADPYVFELDSTMYPVLTAELIDPRLFTFGAKDVVGVTIVATGGTLDLVKEADKWKYAPDPFVELDQKKVQDFIAELAQMRAESYIAYRDADLQAAGLAEAPAALTVRLAGGRQVVMKMTQERPGQLPRKAALVDERRLFLLRQADIEKLMRGLDEYLKTEAKPATPGATPGAPKGPPGSTPPALPPDEEPPAPPPDDSSDLSE